MKPPICCICDERFDPADGGLVSFRRTEEDEAWHRRVEEQGLVGHPPNQEWFCSEHLARARELRAQTLRDALSRWTD